MILPVGISYPILPDPETGPALPSHLATERKYNLNRRIHFYWLTV